LISIRAAKYSCVVCWLFAEILATLPFRALPGGFWIFAVFIALTVLIPLYNATKMPLLMGLCRALNVVYGGVAAIVSCGCDIGEKPVLVLGGLAAVWFAYIWVVTRYSKGEENDPEKKRRVGALVGGIVYLQLMALIALALAFPQVRAVKMLLVAGGAMLVLLRLFKSLFPKVSAS